VDTTNLACFVTEDYRLAVEGGDDKELGLEYVFDLETRQMLFVGKPQPSFTRELRHDAVARNYFDQLVGTPEKLIEFAGQGGLSKALLTSLLEPRIRGTFRKVCEIYERAVTVACGSGGDPCLEDGCAFEGTDETCLNAILLKGGKCLKDCVDVWALKFRDSENRIDVWRR
jgi:hypothetical protein